jgi:predicted Rossmann-fold nucleotide-binding protein
MLRKLPIVGVFGAGTPLTAERARFAHAIGAMVASLGGHLLTGAGYGVMAAAAEGFVSAAGRLGLSIGIVPRDPDGPFDRPNRDPDGRAYPNPFVEIAIRTPLPPRVDDWQAAPARNHINVLTADAIVALPGGDGTGNELDMAAEYRDERARPRAERRTILAGPADEFERRHRELFTHAGTLGEAEQHVRRVLAARGFALELRAAQ